MRLSTSFGCCCLRFVDRLFGLSDCAPIFNDAIKGERLESVAVTHVEFALELHPGKSKQILVYIQ